MSQERRRSQRFPTQQAVFITFVNGGREAIGGTMENISYGGALLYCDRYCDRSTAVGSQVEVLLEFPPQARGNSILVWCTGKVLRVERELKDGKFGIAVGFEQLQVLPRA